MTREEYLNKLVAAMEEWFVEAGYPLPPNTLRVSVGFPSRAALSRSKQRIGECWSPESSADGSIHLLVSPVIGDVVRAADVLLHELCHAAVGTDAKHGPEFKRCAKAMGLVGKATATEASEELKARLTRLTDGLGAYPHVALTPRAKDAKKQTTRMLKVACGDCDYILRGSRATLDKGIPDCPVCGKQLAESGGKDTEEATDDN